MRGGGSGWGRRGVWGRDREKQQRQWFCLLVALLCKLVLWCECVCIFMCVCAMGFVSPVKASTKCSSELRANERDIREVTEIGVWEQRENMKCQLIEWFQFSLEMNHLLFNFQSNIWIFLLKKCYIKLTEKSQPNGGSRIKDILTSEKYLWNEINLIHSSL